VKLDAPGTQDHALCVMHPDEDAMKGLKDQYSVNRSRSLIG
jgi:hypothetical protein